MEVEWSRDWKGLEGVKKMDSEVNDWRNGSEDVRVGCRHPQRQFRHIDRLSVVIYIACGIKYRKGIMYIVNRNLKTSR